MEASERESVEEDEGKDALPPSQSEDGSDGEGQEGESSSEDVESVAGSSSNGEVGSDNEGEEPVTSFVAPETLVAGRQRRTTAGRR
jgi:hypothetical protein